MGALTRELMGVSKKLLTPSVTEAVVAKVNQRRITNSKELRKLRTVLRDSVAAAHFLTDDGDIESAMLRIAAPRESDQKGLLAELSALCESLERCSWTELENLKGNALAREKIRQATSLLERLGHTIGRNAGADNSGGG